MRRTPVVLGLGALILGFALIAFSRDNARSTDISDALEQTEITMFKAPSCLCCDKWGDHVEEAGYSVTAKSRDDMSDIKNELGVPGDLVSCHTGVVDGYVVEGHVPADAIAKMLTERPKITGIAVAGMPAGSPGMESDRPQPYNVFAFDPSGRRYIFGRY